MGKAKRSDHELTRERKLTRENKELRKENSRLRKLLSRFENFNHIKDVLEEDQKERVQETQKVLEDLKKSWACHDCPEGVLEITIYQRLNQSYYFRSCDNCGKRTQGKPYDSDVKGIFRKAIK